MPQMLEKTLIKNSMVAEPIRSFSQFPPSVYRRSFAATKIQRAFRRYRGIKTRKAIRIQQHNASIIIQRAARRKLVRIRSLKNIAAFIIQKAWRRRVYIRLALMSKRFFVILGCIYRKPIRELHRCATLIQAKWRHWHAFRNSPIAAEYKIPVEGIKIQTNTLELKAKVNFIQTWWKPLHEKRKEREFNQAVIIIIFIIATQSCNRHSKDLERYNKKYNIQGYSLRQLLVPSLRQKLLKLGTLVATRRYYSLI